MTRILRAQNFHRHDGPDQDNPCRTPSLAPALACPPPIGDSARVSDESRHSPAPIGIHRNHPVARRIIERWRWLGKRTGGSGSGEPTLVACSGGVDSAALALALASTGLEITLGFAEHDARPVHEVHRDRDVVRQLAAALGCGFVSEPCPTPPGSEPTEGLMRRVRYELLARIARDLRIRVVATGHHADDQLETVLLALIRGGGPAGMAGVAPARAIDRNDPVVQLIRPMLQVTRAECEQLCLDAGLKPPGSDGPCWAEDATNTDTRHIRNRIRHIILPQLEAIRPGLAPRVSRNAEWFRQMRELLHDQAVQLDRASRLSRADDRMVWKREDLREALEVVVGELFRQASIELAGGAGADRFGAEKIARVVGALQDSGTDPRHFELGAGFGIVVTAREVQLVHEKAPLINGADSKGGV